MDDEVEAGPSVSGKLDREVSCSIFFMERGRRRDRGRRGRGEEVMRAMPGRVAETLAVLDEMRYFKATFPA
jgi:hypothetical protein